jgi:Tfp pilus assembly protein PilO
MSLDRIWIIGLSGLLVVVGALGWILGISPIVAQASAANDQRAAIATANAASETRIAVLKKQFANIGDLKTQLDKLSDSVPSNADMAVFLREIDAMTTQYQVKLASVTVNDAQKYVPIAAAAAAPATPGSSATSTPSPSPSDSSASTVSATPAPSGPGARLVVVPVKIGVTGSYANVMAFVGGLQSGARLYLMTELSVKTSQVSGGFAADITGSVYALPMTGTTATTASGTPTPTPAPSASASSTPSPSSTP